MLKAPREWPFETWFEVSAGTVPYSETLGLQVQEHYPKTLSIGVMEQYQETVLWGLAPGMAVSFQYYVLSSFTHLIIDHPPIKSLLVNFFHHISRYLVRGNYCIHVFLSGCGESIRTEAMWLLFQSVFDKQPPSVTEVISLKNCN